MLDIVDASHRSYRVGRSTVKIQVLPLPGTKQSVSVTYVFDGAHIATYRGAFKMRGSLSSRSEASHALSLGLQANAETLLGHLIKNHGFGGLAATQFMEVVRSREILAQFFGEQDPLNVPEMIKRQFTGIGCVDLSRKLVKGG